MEPFQTANLAQLLDLKMRTINKLFEQQVITATSYLSAANHSALKTNPHWNKTARIRAKPWMFRLPFRVYEAVITLKKFNETKQNEKKLSPHTRYKIQKDRFRSL